MGLITLKSGTIKVNANQALGIGMLALAAPAGTNPTASLQGQGTLDNPVMVQASSGPLAIGAISGPTVATAVTIAKAVTLPAGTTKIDMMPNAKLSFGGEINGVGTGSKLEVAVVNALANGSEVDLTTLPKTAVVQAMLGATVKVNGQSTGDMVQGLGGTITINSLDNQPVSFRESPGVTLARVEAVHRSETGHYPVGWFTIKVVGPKNGRSTVVGITVPLGVTVSEVEGMPEDELLHKTFNGDQVTLLLKAGDVTFTFGLKERKEHRK
jgi:hypothetical protein